MNDKPQVVQRVLTLLRQFGWEIGYKKLEEELRGSAAETDSQDLREFFLGWMAAERGDYAEAVRQFDAARKVPAMLGWALLGGAFVALRRKDFLLAHQTLTAARQQCGEDTQLQATIAHVEGAALYHQGRPEQAKPLLIEAMKLYGTGHFAIGRVLDTLGMIYAGRENFQGAREFFERALVLKRSDDLAGLAVSNGQLGRLYLDWGYLDSAQRHFEEDLRISQQIGDEAGKAIMYNFLGQVRLIRGEQEAAANRMAAARQEWDAASGWLESATTLSRQSDWPITQAYARKDQARLALAQGDLAAAESHATAAQEIFRRLNFPEGIAHVNRVWGMLHSRQRRWEAAQTSLRAARRHFEEAGEPAEVARTLFESALASAAAGEPRPLVSSALLEALAAAESCRRAQLVRRIEEELKLVDFPTYFTRVYRRVRGRSVQEDAFSLIDGTRESATALFLDLQGSTELSRFRDPGEMMMTLNQMMADLSVVLRRHDAQVTAFRGDGFMALLRGPGDAVRGVETALDLHAAMAVFNEPRLPLGLPPFVARIGVNSGEVFLGNVGTYDKLDFSAVGNTVNLAARLEGCAEPGMPCIGRGTWEKVHHLFRFSAASPRTEKLKGLGATQVWDVAGRIDESVVAVPPASVVPPISVEEIYAKLAMTEPVKPAQKLYVHRRVNATMWEFAFGSDATETVGKHLVGFVYISLLLGSPDREFKPLDLLQQGGSLSRLRTDSRAGATPEDSAQADREMGNDDRLDDRAVQEYRDRAQQLREQLKSTEDSEKRQELEFIESQLKSATGPVRKRVAAGANRLKLDYNAVKKAIDNALVVLADHKLVDLVAHLSTHVELSIKSCRYRNSERIDWSAGHAI